MENFDPSVEQQVWQRVLAQPEQPQRDDLRGLQLSAAELAAAYRHLANTLTGRDREQAKRLYEGERANIACLRGMRVLSGAAGVKPKTMNASKEPAGKLLEKCYHRTRRAMAEYTARSVDGEFGEAFRKMARREGEHCAMIAELLGNIHSSFTF